MSGKRSSGKKGASKRFDPEETFSGDDLGGPDLARENEETMEQYMGDLGGVLSPNSGTIASGKIVKISDSEIYVDIGMKTEGVIPIQEFAHDPAPQIGQPVEVLIVKIDEQEGNITVSKNKARLIKAWDLADEAFQKGSTIKARIVAKVKGGLSADFNGLKAFVPGSLMSLQQEYDLEKYVNQEFDFKIIELNRRRRNMVLSRKAILEEERKRVVADIFQRLKPGDVCDGRIKNITDYGAFVSLEGGKIDGLLHKADMSWAHVRDISKVLKVGDTIQVKILHIDKDSEKISLGL
ncbi:MAG: S1 RNA-binding domain-containing protein, partial [Candidatus Riflebacteria bacterium]|nr:S1 RNA-binding domain-containing protein [Candidatus Riflebacteria bacterium]